MITEREIKQAKKNFDNYIKEGLLKKDSNETAKQMYIKNAENSLITAQKLKSLEDENYSPDLWIIVSSYYSMFYISNAVLLNLGYKVGDKIVHKITSDCLITLVRDKLKKELFSDYEEIEQEAMEIINARGNEIIYSFEQEREKRSKFQYQMSETIKKSKAKTSLERAKTFVFEMKKLL
ncbi:MAG: hypothetical protein ACOCXG_01745 [Nanoarchaeota archaeon]